MIVCAVNLRDEISSTNSDPMGWKCWKGAFGSSRILISGWCIYVERFLPERFTGRKAALSVEPIFDSPI